MIADARSSVQRPGSTNGADRRSADICGRWNCAMFNTGIGPAISPKKFQAVRSKGGTWCAIRLYRHFTHRDFEEQGSAPSHPRNAKCRRRPGFGPTVSPNMIWAVRSKGGGTWCAIRLYRHFAHRDFEEQGSAPSHPRNAKCRRRPGVGPTVLAPGHRGTGPGKRR
jgi:hypothetical protein